MVVPWKYLPWLCVLRRFWHWLPLNAFLQRQRSTPMHLPPFKQGMRHLEYWHLQKCWTISVLCIRENGSSPPPPPTTLFQLTGDRSSPDHSHRCLSECICRRWGTFQRKCHPKAGEWLLVVNVQWWVFKRAIKGATNLAVSALESVQADTLARCDTGASVHALGVAKSRLAVFTQKACLGEERLVLAAPGEGVSEYLWGKHIFCLGYIYHYHTFCRIPDQGLDRSTVSSVSGESAYQGGSGSYLCW